MTDDEIRSHRSRIKLTMGGTMTTITEDDLFRRVARANGLRGRQRVTDVWSDAADAWVFDSNARGGYGETLTFHYKTDGELLGSLGLGSPGARIERLPGKLYEIIR